MTDAKQNSDDKMKESNSGQEAVSDPATEPLSDTDVTDVASEQESSQDPAPLQPDPAEEIAQLKDKLLRALAEGENLRRRAERDVADARVFAITKFARDMLSVQDNLDRALDAIGQTDQSNSTGGLKALREGIELTHKELITTLERHGVKKIESDGARFDPNFHQALFEVEHNDAAPGTVVQTMQIGYALGERTLRPAMVGIAKAPANPPADQPATMDNSQ